MKIFKKEIYNYALYGALFGACFPIMSFFILDSPNLLFGIICTAPLFLGLFAALAGLKQDKTNEEVLLRTKEYKEMREKAEEASKLKSNFLAIMSHEIRTPMNAILTSATLMQQNVKKDENIEMLNLIRSAGDCLLNILNDILDFSKIESGNLKIENRVFNLNKTISDVVKLFSHQAGQSSVVLDLEMEADFPEYILGDEYRLKQVLNNYITNAIKFTGTFVRVHVSFEEFDDGIRNILIKVEDDGIGIPEDVKGKLFADFSQVDASTTRKFGGTGLGLAICKGIAEKMGGKVWFESELGRGSSFFFEVPLKLSEIPASIETENELVNENLGASYPLKILFVDDNSLNQIVSKKLFSKLGIEVDIASNGKMALHHFKKNNYDLIFMDVQMPEMDGIEATRQIRNVLYNSEVQIFSISANTQDEDLQSYLDAGMNGHLSKPLKVREVSEIIKKVFNGLDKAA